MTAGELSMDMVGMISDWAYDVLIMLPDHALRWQEELSHSALQLGRATAVDKDVGATHYLNLKYYKRNIRNIRYIFEILEIF